MASPADFGDAHSRHREDAELLFREQRWANADHLYGLSAECGLNSRWIKRPAWESVLEEMGNPVVRAGAGRFPHRVAARIACAIRSALFSRGGRTLPAPLPGGASRRVGARWTFLHSLSSGSCWGWEWKWTPPGSRLRRRTGAMSGSSGGPSTISSLPGAVRDISVRFPKESRSPIGRSTTATPIVLM